MYFCVINMHKFAWKRTNSKKQLSVNGQTKDTTTQIHNVRGCVMGWCWMNGHYINLVFWI